MTMNHHLPTHSERLSAAPTSPIKAPTPAPLMAIEVRLSKPWVISMPEGDFMVEDIQSAIDMGEVYIEVMSEAGHWRWIFQKDCVEGGIKVNLSPTLITVDLNLKAMVRGVKAGEVAPDPSRWKLQGICFAHVFGVNAQSLYRS